MRYYSGTVMSERLFEPEIAARLVTGLVTRASFISATRARYLAFDGNAE